MILEMQSIQSFSELTLQLGNAIGFLESSLKVQHVVMVCKPKKQDCWNLLMLLLSTNLIWMVHNVMQTNCVNHFISGTRRHLKSISLVLYMEKVFLK